MNISRMTLATLAATMALGLAVFSTPSHAQVTPGGAGERHANEAPGVSSKGAMRRSSAKRHRHHHRVRASAGTQTRSDPATIGTSGRDKQTGAPKDKD